MSDVDFCILDECLAYTHLLVLHFSGLLLEDFAANSEIAELEEELTQLTLTEQPIIGELNISRWCAVGLCLP